MKLKKLMKIDDVGTVRDVARISNTVGPLMHKFLSVDGFLSLDNRLAS